MKRLILLILVTCWISPAEAGRPQDMLASENAQNWAARYNAGIRAIEQGRYSEAAELFQSAIRNLEASEVEGNALGMSVYGLALSRYRQNEFANAAPLFRRSLTMLERNLGPEHPDVVRILQYLATSLQKAGDFVEAEQCYRQILMVRGSNSPKSDRDSILPAIESFLTVVSEGYLKDSQFEGKSRKFRRTISASKLSKDLYMLMLDQLMPIELNVEAETVMLSAVGTFPNSRQVRSDLAEMYVSFGRFEKALDSFKEALQTPGQDPAQDRRERGSIYQRIGAVDTTLLRFDNALSAYRSALELSPDSTETLGALGELYIWLDQLDNAREQYTRAVSIGPVTAKFLSGLAEVNLRLGRFPESAAAAAKALELDPKRQHARYILSAALIRSNRREESERVLNDYRKLEKDETAGRKRLQEVLDLNNQVGAMLTKGRSREATALLREGIHLHPETTQLRLRLGLVLSRVGQHQEAVELFESLIKSGYGSFVMHWIIAGEYEILGDMRASQEHRVLSLQLMNDALRPRTN